MYVMIKTKIRGGLPVWASGVYYAADAGYPEGQWARPATPSYIEDLTIRFMRSMHAYPIEKLSQKELERVENELIDHVEKGAYDV